MVKNKIFLFVDGTNLYAGQYELFGPKKFIDFSKFIKKVEEKLKTRFNQIFFYASYTPRPKNPTNKQRLYLKNEFLFYQSVKKTNHIIFFKGYRSKTSGKEKEVDVKLTADIVSYGFLNKYQEIYLFTGDADFLQALFTIKELKKNIYLICLQNKLMYKGAFYFKTHIIDINHTGLKLHPKQNIKIIRIKNPDELCHRVG